MRWQVVVVLIIAGRLSAQVDRRPTMDTTLFRAVVSAVRDSVAGDLRVDPKLLRADADLFFATKEDHVSDSMASVSMRRDVLRSLVVAEGDVLARIACAGVLVPPASEDLHRECPSQPYSVVGITEPRAEPMDSSLRSTDESRRVSVHVLVYRFAKPGLTVRAFDYVLARSAQAWKLKRVIARSIAE